MATRTLLSEPAVRVLVFLLDLAAQRAGYMVLGFSGWACADQIEAGARTWGTSELMRALARRGRVLQFDARAPGEVRPVWIYRISQTGADELAAFLGLAAAGVPAPANGEEPRILIRKSTWHAIEGLRAALDPAAKSGREWISGETGWRSSRELTTSMAREDEAAGTTSYRWFNSEDLRWLVRLRFAEERVIDRTHVYRLLPLGAALRPLEWKEPRNG
jgi:hypothetical protein